MKTDRLTALKVFRHAEPFQREAAAYARLAERRVLDVEGHRVPQIDRVDEGSLAIEMTIVHLPYVLDFASALMGHAAPEIPDHVKEDRLARNQVEMGSNWPTAASVLISLCRLGSM